MPTPDAAAAADPRHVPLHELTHEHLGAVLTFRDVTGTLADLPVPAKIGDGLAFSIVEQGRSFHTVLTGPPGETVEIAQEAPPSPHDEEANAEAKTPEHLAWAREMAEIHDAKIAHEGEIEGLNKRYGELEKKIMGYYELAGDTQLPFDGRLAYLKSRSFPVYRERPAEDGGGTYGAADVVDALRKIGRTGNIKPETVNPQTLGAILREYRDAEEAVPKELAKLVELGETYSVAIGPPGRKRR
jgi:hypothetical protein